MCQARRPGWAAKGKCSAVNFGLGGNRGKPHTVRVGRNKDQAIVSGSKILVTLTCEQSRRFEAG